MSNKSIKIATTPEELAREYRAGATIRQLAAKYGCSFQNINARLSNAGVGMRPTSGTREAPQKVCPTCGTTFKASPRTQRFCRSQCIRKKAVCTRGHVLTEENRYHFPGSASRCKACVHIRQKAYAERKKHQA